MPLTHLAKRIAPGKVNLQRTECLKSNSKHNLWISNTSEFNEWHQSHPDWTCPKCVEIGMKQDGRVKPLSEQKVQKIKEEQNTMYDLVSILKTQTESLKIQYVELTKEWAENEFIRLWNWAKDYQAGKFGSEKASRTYHALPYEIVNPNGKMEVWIEKRVKEAEQHYEDSIKKLAYRIGQKKLDTTNIKIKTSHIGVNIDTTLTDGQKTVRAWTIIASGPIQRPHYRYLIK